MTETPIQEYVRLFGELGYSVEKLRTLDHNVVFYGHKPAPQVVRLKELVSGHLPEIVEGAASYA